MNCKQMVLSHTKNGKMVKTKVAQAYFSGDAHSTIF